MAEQTERVRVTMRDGLQLDIEDPFVSGDQLMGKGWRTLGINRVIGNTDNVSVPLADILQLEVRRVNQQRYVGVQLLVYGGLLYLLLNAEMPM